MNELKKTNELTKIVDDFNAKFSAIEENIKMLEAAGKKFENDCVVLGTYSGVQAAPHFYLHERDVKKSLTSSAWRCVYAALQIDRIASANDKQMFHRIFEEAPEFTKETVSAAFKDYLVNPRSNILRGLAEVFSSLDDAYKSHSNVKIGVNGLPKRVVIHNVNSSYGYGHDKIRDILNALAAYQGLGVVDYLEIQSFMKDQDALKETRGVWLKRFKNGNGHLFFSPKCLRDINMALAEYYGYVLPDAYEHSTKPECTDVAKDLQFYRTPKKVAEKLVGDIYLRDGYNVLEPSCGDGAFLDALRSCHCDVKYAAFGYEIHAGRAQTARNKNYSVSCANFLEVNPSPVYDVVVMNPPFYGKHYEKHVRHALRFLKEDGVLHAILPSSARYDHKLLEDLRPMWSDLPVGSFSESGTNIPTCTVKIKVERK